ncbi:MAG: TetR/AcrR family transcriptional regulator [Anaerolineaceae bacterium]
MPTTTFNNLPQEKKEMILSAARREFARAPLNDVSINKIIRDANISRGSFYMYFKGKKDLLYYILSEYITQMIDEADKALKNSKGDIFAVFIDIYDFTISYSTTRQQEMAIMTNLFASMHSNGGRPGEEIDMQELFKLRGEAPRLEEIVKTMDVENLNIKNMEDWEDLFAILLAITQHSIAQALFDMPNLSPASNIFPRIPESTSFQGLKGSPPSRERFLNMINIIKYGIIKRSSITAMEDVHVNV